MIARCTRIRWRALAVERCPGHAAYSGADGQGLCEDHAISQVRLYGLEALEPPDRPRFAGAHLALLLEMDRQPDARSWRAG